MPYTLIATGYFTPWDQLSEAGNLVVILFGMFLWVVCLISLIGLGMRIILTEGNKRGKGKRGTHTNHRA
jgi:hypothetical protein